MTRFVDDAPVRFSSFLGNPIVMDDWPEVLCVSRALLEKADPRFLCVEEPNILKFRCANGRATYTAVQWIDRDVAECHLREGWRVPLPKGRRRKVQ